MANGNGKKKGRKKWWIIGGVTVLALTGALVVYARSGGHQIDPSKLTAVEKGDLAKSVVATGKVQPIVQVELKSKASGIVKKLLVDAGDRVKTGQVLAELDKEEIQAQVESARAQLNATESNMTAAEADMERAKVDAEGPEVPLLQRAYGRAKQMASEGVVSQAALDDAERAYTSSLNKQNVARAQLTVRAKSPIGLGVHARAELGVERSPGVPQRSKRLGRNGP